MVSYVEEDERVSFSSRLKAALTARGYNTSPSSFVDDFNLRADGLVVTVHAARKWLIGEAIPTQARLQIIANWLGISAAWLRFGDAGNSSMVAMGDKVDPVDAMLANDIGLLSDSNRRIIRVLVESMLLEQNEGAGYSRAPRHASRLTKK